MGRAGHSGVRTLTQPLHPSCHTRSCFNEQWRAPPPPMWEQEQLLSLWGKGKGWGHSWQLLNTLLQPGMAKILIAPGVYDSEDTDSQEKGQSNLSRPEGCVRRPS